MEIIFTELQQQSQSEITLSFAVGVSARIPAWNGDNNKATTNGSFQ